VRDSVCPSCGYSEPLGCLLDMAQPVCAACGATLAPGTAPDADAGERAERLVHGAGLLLLAGAPPDHPLAGRAARTVAVTPDELLALVQQ
jgi:hypothetical protein